MAWEGSDRRERLPKDWGIRRAKVLERDRYQCKIQGDGCVSLGVEVDHIIPGDDHSLGNLQAACSWCHGKKTATEANAARKRYSMRRPAERHPGLK